AVPGRVPAVVRALAAEAAARIEVAVDAHWMPGRLPATLPRLVLQGLHGEEGSGRRSALAAAGGGVA
ncbi:MAG TPA: hypothetical protein VGP96_05770, partial [Candidatus Dormibacteraeota bacterium]|nr:hypothetical protein [Candidatus Dormibacteraeota bacterium]